MRKSIEQRESCKGFRRLTAVVACFQAQCATGSRLTYAHELERYRRVMVGVSVDERDELVYALDVACSKSIAFCHGVQSQYVPVVDQEEGKRKHRTARLAAAHQTLRTLYRRPAMIEFLTGMSACLDVTQLPQSNPEKRLVERWRYHRYIIHQHTTAPERKIPELADACKNPSSLNPIVQNISGGPRTGSVTGLRHRLSLSSTPLTRGGVVRRNRRA